MSTSINDLPYNPPEGGKIPERDIPRDTINHVIDQEAKAHYIPVHPHYIPSPPPMAPRPSLIAHYIDEFRVPLVLSLLYYIFQLGAVQDMMLKFTPFLFKPDAGLNSYGAFFKSVLFGFSYFGLNTFMETVA
jgi:hypothetical protein